MSHAVSWKPDRVHAITPYLIVHDCAAAIRFYEAAFDGQELQRIAGSGEKIGHAEMLIGDSVIMMADEHPEVDARAPRSIGGSPVSFCLYVADVDAAVAKAVSAGAAITRPIQNQFYGDRSGMITDPFGYTWNVATHIEDVPPDELQRRAAAAHG